MFVALVSSTQFSGYVLMNSLVQQLAMCPSCSEARGPVTVHPPRLQRAGSWTVWYLLFVLQVLSGTVSNGVADAVDMPASQSMMLEDLMSSLQARKSGSGAVTASTVEAPAPMGPAPKASPQEIVDTSSTADIQDTVQNRMQGAASAAGSFLQNSGGELKEADITSQMQGLVPESRDDVLSLILGVGGTAAVLLLTTIVQAVQHGQSDKVCALTCCMQPINACTAAPYQNVEQCTME